MPMFMCTTKKEEVSQPTPRSHIIDSLVKRAQGFPKEQNSLSVFLQLHFLKRFPHLQKCGKHRWGYYLSSIYTTLPRYLPRHTPTTRTSPLSFLF